jgi:hypothetical protein
MKRKLHKTLILWVVLYRRVTFPLASRGEHRLRVLVNRVLGRVLGRKRDEVLGGWIKLHNEQLDKFTPPKILLE